MTTALKACGRRPMVACDHEPHLEEFYRAVASVRPLPACQRSGDPVHAVDAHRSGAAASPATANPRPEMRGRRDVGSSGRLVVAHQQAPARLDHGVQRVSHRITVPRGRDKIWKHVYEGEAPLRSVIDGVADLDAVGPVWQSLTGEFDQSRGDVEPYGSMRRSAHSTTDSISRPLAQPTSRTCLRGRSLARCARAAAATRSPRPVRPHTPRRAGRPRTSGVPRHRSADQNRRVGSPRAGAQRRAGTWAHEIGVA
jgi:hypothetical protein